MGEAPEKDRNVNRQEAEQSQEQRRDASGGGARRPADEDDDPREEEGWTQPESSAQKGAFPDEG